MTRSWLGLLRRAWLLLALLACTPPARAPEAPAALPPSPAFAHGRHGAVSSAEWHASSVGLDVLKRGGNAVDAAIAVAFALGVTQPSAGNIGGGGFLLVRLPDGSSNVIDYREVAPGAARSDLFLDASGEVTDGGQFGPLAAGIPGVVAGLALAHARYGTRPWRELVAPAIRLARDGVRLDEVHARELGAALAAVQARLALARQKRQPALASALLATARSFGSPSGESLPPGALWRQPELARSLELIAGAGADAFYRGELAERMLTEMQALGGLWTRQDLARYRALERAPIQFSYHGHEIVTMPPPSGGGIVLRQILAASEQLQLQELDWDSLERIHLYVEILRRAYADRNRLLGDPDFVSIPLARLLDPAYTARRIADIDRRRATPSAQIRPAEQATAESLHTTHFSVVDAQGSAVANTFTLNTDFGALLQLPGTGVTLNNEMDDFTAKPGAPNLFDLVQGAQNAIEPGKRPLSSMTPTIVSGRGRLRAVLGSPGGPTITTTVAQVLLQLIDHGRSLEQAVRAPRLHHQWLPDEIWYEPGVPAATIVGLQQLGHHLEPEQRLGHAHCIEVDPRTGERRAVADVQRGGGAALAY